MVAFRILFLKYVDTLPVVNSINKGVNSLGAYGHGIDYVEERCLVWDFVSGLLFVMIVMKSPIVLLDKLSLCKTLNVGWRGA